MAARVPQYRRQRHKNRADLAYCTINGRRHWLGRYGSPESHAAFARLTTVAAMTDAPRAPAEPPPFRPSDNPTVTEVMAAYVPVIEADYGFKSSAWYQIRSIMRSMRKHFGTLPAAEFRARRLKELRDHWIADGWGREYIRTQVNKLRLIFRWAVSEELIPPETHASLMSVKHFRAGKCDAHETPPVEPVSDDLVAATLPFLPERVAVMVRVQRLCGCRPGELIKIRKRDINRTRDVWVCELKKHKTVRFGKRRFIHFGPKAQALLLPYLVCGDDDHIFPIRRDSYQTAIARACEKHGLEHWFPNQLRHTSGTEVREQLGLEAAQLHLGHSRADVTQIYAETSKKKAAEVARRLG